MTKYYTLACLVFLSLSMNLNCLLQLHNLIKINIQLPGVSYTIKTRINALCSNNLLTLNYTTNTEWCMKSFFVDNLYE